MRANYVRRDNHNHNLKEPTMAVKMKKSIKPRDLGKGEALVIADKNINSITFGVILGRADSVRETSMADAAGEIKTYRALAGSFSAFIYAKDEDFSKAVRRPADAASGLLYLPEGIADMFISAVEAADGDAVIEFALELGCSRASNPRGYEWFGVPLLEPDTATDPMALLLKRVSTLALTDGTADETEVEQPAVKTAGAKAKATAK
jgi:hypothetical protein